MPDQIDVIKTHGKNDKQILQLRTPESQNQRKSPSTD